MAGLPLKRDNGKSGVQKKKLNGKWRPLGVSKAAQKNTLALLYKKSLALAKRGKIKEAQTLLAKAEKIRQSL